MVGTLFLWMYWPSFNGALAFGVAQQRVVITTVLSISASGLTAIFMSILVKGKFDMEVLLNSTLAGGVAIGTASDLCFNAAAPLVIGGFAGVISAAGYLYFNAFLQEKVKYHDTCGVLFLHGIPGVLGGIFGAIGTAMAEDSFDNAYAIEQTFGEVKADGSGRTIQEQAVMQIAALGVTLAMSLFSGVLCGFICGKLPMPDSNFDDTMHFEHVDYSDEISKYSLAEGKPVPPGSKAPMMVA
jgi:ammonium transporter Rh